MTGQCVYDWDGFCGMSTSWTKSSQRRRTFASSFAVTWQAYLPKLATVVSQIVKKAGREQMCYLGVFGGGGGG